MVTKLIGASVWEATLYDHLTSHEEQERGMLSAYQEAATTSGSSAFRYLSSLIIEDEIRHHRIFRDLASALKTDAELAREEPVVPRLGHWGPDPAEVVRLTDKLLDQERGDAKALHRLTAELKEVKDTSMWHLLVKLMEMDTAKHIEILEFVKRHARKALK
jgi:rubrerythrin